MLPNTILLTSSDIIASRDLVPIPVCFVYKLNDSAKSVVLFSHLELISNIFHDAISCKAVFGQN